MASMTPGSVARQIESLFERGSLTGLSDRLLLERFNTTRDDAGEAAFATLVDRHGPMVLDVCRQILGDPHHAEDAFQAVFLVLANRARSIRDPDLLGNWLYGVALRTARCARLQLARRRRREEAALMSRPVLSSASLSEAAEQPGLDPEQAEILHDQIGRLPQSFRLPVVLCYFEGLTLDEAARRLRCPAGTVRSRLARARDKLRRSLRRRGIVLPAVALTAVLECRPISASVSTSLCDITTKAAINFAAGTAALPAVAMLARHVLRAMLVNKLKLGAVTCLLLVAAAAGAGFVGQAPARQAGKPGLPIALKADDAEGKPGPGRMFVVGRVLDPQGKPVANAVTMVYAALKHSGRRTYEGWRPETMGTARSDIDGRFQMDAPRTSSARHHLVGAVALAPGYGAGWVNLEADTERTEVNITLRPERLIQGRLFDVTGRPVRGVAVRVETMGRFIPAHLASHRDETIDGPSFSSQSGNGLPAWPTPGFSDADGRFTIHGAGQNLRVVLAIDDLRFARQRFPIDTTVSPISEPVKLALEPAQTIKGRITDASTGKPIPHAGLVIYSLKRNEALVDEFETDSTGRFHANPRANSHFEILAMAPNGQPSLGLSKSFDWPKGAIEYSIDFALPRGALIHGMVTEESSGKPVAGARISFGPRRAENVTSGTWNGNAESAADGSFELPVLPGPGYLIVLGPTDDFVLRAENGDRAINPGSTGNLRFYAHAFIPCHPKAAGDRVEVDVALRRGVTVNGEVIGPDRQPIRKAMMISPLFLEPSLGFQLAVRWKAHYHGNVKNGRFEVHGIDPDAETPVYFFDPDHELGATVYLSGKSPALGSVVVKLDRCGTARARLVDRAGKPVAEYRGSSLIAMVVTPGPYPRFRRPDDSLMSANVATINGIDPIHYADGPISDSLGRITFPALIPGATYRRTPRNTQEASSNTEFTVRPDETLSLGDLVIDERHRQ